MARKKTKRKEPVATVTSVPERNPEKEAAAAGQSGDLQGLSDIEEADSESVRELIEEGQFYEASVVEGVENAPPADAGPLPRRERKEDDIPPEYTDQVSDEPKE